MIILKDILPIFTKHQISFKEKHREAGDIYTFTFGMNEKVDWKAGQHGIFTIKHVKIKKPTRPFSIASISSEGNVKISMKIGKNPSEFKQTLLDLKTGTKISMRGPIGSFYPQNKKNLLFIAGGIGITPFRALLKDIDLNYKEAYDDIKLLYIDNKEEFIYTKELDEASKNSAIKIKYINNREKSNKEIQKFISKYNNDAEYFVVGSKLMVKTIKNLLKSKGIDKKNIKNDTFIGY